MAIARRNSETWLPDIFNDFFDTNWMSRTNATAPAINVLEHDDKYEIQLAAPGLTKEDFKVSLDADGNLSINMEKKQEENGEKKHGHYLRREFSYSQYIYLIFHKNLLKTQSSYIIHHDYVSNIYIRLKSFLHLSTYYS